MMQYNSAMIITLSELNKAINALPEPHIAREMERHFWHVPIEPEMPVWPLYENPSPIEPEIRIATFELKKVTCYGSIRWCWAPCDEIIIDKHERSNYSP